MKSLKAYLAFYAMSSVFCHILLYLIFRQFPESPYLWFLYGIGPGTVGIFLIKVRESYLKHEDSRTAKGNTK